MNDAATIEADGPGLTQRTLDLCRDALFTGSVRVRAKQGDGEVWLLSGIVEQARFGVSTGDEALERLVAADDPRVDATPALPNPSGGFKRGLPLEGELTAALGVVDLLRFCETYALTCSLALANGDASGEAAYHLGELTTVRCNAGGDRAVAQMLEWRAGTFRFTLPTVDVPRPEAEDEPPTSLAAPEPAPIAWKAAASAALKRKVEEVDAKQRRAEASRVPEVPTAPSVVVEPGRLPPSADVADKKLNRAQRRALARAEVSAASKRPTVVVHLRRVTVEHVRVAVPASIEGAEDRLAEAARRAQIGGVRWELERPTTIELHADQMPRS